MIIEAALLTDEEKITASTLTKAAGADFVKTSTGFGPGGATVADVALMRRVVGAEMGVKAAGGVRDLEGLKAMVAAGATRIGASAGVKIVQESTRAEAVGRRRQRLLSSVGSEPRAPAPSRRRRAVPETAPRRYCASKALPDSLPQLAPDLVLLLRHGLDPQLQLHRPIRERVDAHDLERFEDEDAEVRVLLQLGADLTQELRHPVDVLVIGDRERDDVEREVLALVGERGDRAIREDVQRSLFVAQHDRPQVDLFDQPADAVDRRGVADAHLILEDHEEAADDVAHQRLRAKADRQAGDAGAR